MKSTPHVDEISHGKVLEVDLHGKLSRQDYERVIPEAERLIAKFDKIRVLVTMRDFEGWEAGALWEDLKWETRHFTDIERLAVVGEETWHKWMPGFCNAFSKAEVRYFTFAQFEEAHAWIYA
jgi:hypothetical protein